MGDIDLQQPSQERNVVGPFLLSSVPEGEGALNASRISSEALVLLVQSYMKSVHACYTDSYLRTVFGGIARGSRHRTGAAGPWW